MAGLPSLVPGDAFVPPFGAITPERHYFAFGTPIPTDELDPSDRAGCEAAYANLRAQVEGGMKQLREDVRPKDDYRGLAARLAWEALYDDQAPGPSGYGMGGN